MQLFVSPVNNFFQSFFSEEARSALRSSEPLCLSAFLSYAHFTPLCQTLFSPSAELFSYTFINHLITFIIL